MSMQTYSPLGLTSYKWPVRFLEEVFALGLNLGLLCAESEVHGGIAVVSCAIAVSAEASSTECNGAGTGQHKLL